MESVRLAAQYKRESDPLSVPSGDLKEKTKRTVYGDLAQLVHLLAEASSSGDNPLCKASATQDGAFVAVNHRAELTGWQGSYLFLCAIAFLHRVELPPLHEYCAKKSETTTPWRWAQEELRLYDPAARTYCAVHALIGASPPAHAACAQGALWSAGRAWAARRSVAAPRKRVPPLTRD